MAIAIHISIPSADRAVRSTDPTLSPHPPGFPRQPSLGDDEMPPLMSPSAPARAEPAAAAPSTPSMAVGTPVKLKGLNGPKHLQGSSVHQGMTWRPSLT